MSFFGSMRQQCELQPMYNVVQPTFSARFDKRYTRPVPCVQGTAAATKVQRKLHIFPEDIW